MTRSPLTPDEKPRPSAAEIQRMLADTLSPKSRWTFALLLAADLAVIVTVASLLATEAGLPLRTRIAFAGILAIAIAWAALFTWTLTRRQVLMSRQRVVAARLGLGASALYTLGCLVLAWLQPSLRTTALAAGATGAVLCAVAWWMLRRAGHRHDELNRRRRELESRLKGPGTAAVVLLALALLLPGAASAQHLTPAPLEVRASEVVSSITALGRHHLVYEVHISNLGDAPRRLAEMTAMTGKRPLASWRGDELARRLRPMGSNQDDHLLLNPGRRTVAYLWIMVEGPAPTGLHHRLATTDEDGDEPDLLTTRPRTVSQGAPALESHPVGEGTWVALRGPSNSSGHRLSLVTLDGAVHVPQRFAVDWALLGGDGRLYRREGLHNRDWYGFGEPVMAAHGGRVVRVVDGIRDHPPLSPGHAARHDSRDDAVGNMVVVDHGEGSFAVYGHLRNGLLAVAEGDRVEAGDSLGAIGNSGHSLAPHLHFHVGDAADPMACEGLPFTLPPSRLVGRLDSPHAAIRGRPWSPSPRRPARTIRGETPLENMVFELGGS